MDDGQSFEFEKGAYIHRRFIFKDGKLTSINIQPTGSGKAQFFSECIIERIILLGHSAKPNSAVIEPSKAQAEIEYGPLLVKPMQGLAFATVRKPNIPIKGDWTIKIL